MIAPRVACPGRMLHGESAFRHGDPWTITTPSEQTIVLCSAACRQKAYRHRARSGVAA